MAYLINNQTTWTNQPAETGIRLPCAASSRKTIPQLRSINEIRLLPMLATGIAEGLRQVQFSGSRQPNKGQIPLGIDCRKRRQRLYALHVLAL